MQAIELIEAFGVGTLVGTFIVAAGCVATEMINGLRALFNKGTTAASNHTVVRERLAAMDRREAQAQQLTAGGHVPTKAELDRFFSDHSWMPR